MSKRGPSLPNEVRRLVITAWEESEKAKKNPEGNLAFFFSTH